ncbi:MAG: hypothetical protein ACO1OF_16395 [Adhaeribacter sp.]
MQGLSLQTTSIVSPLGGFFGISLQSGANALLRVKDANGADLTGATISYPANGTTIIFTTSPISALYPIRVPWNTTTTINIKRQGFQEQSFNVTIAENNFLVIEKTMVLDVSPYILILQENS